MKTETPQENPESASLRCGGLVSTPKHHELKTWPEFFWRVARGEKPFELRRNDRDFKNGDSVRLREWSPESGEYTGNELVARIGYITDFPGSLREGHVCFALEQVILC